MIKKMGFIIICLLASAIFEEPSHSETRIRVNLEASDLSCQESTPILYEWRDLDATSGTVSQEAEINMADTFLNTLASASVDGVLQAGTVGDGFSHCYGFDNVPSISYAQPTWSNDYTNDQATAQTYKLNYKIYGGEMNVVSNRGLPGRYPGESYWFQADVSTEVIVNGDVIKRYWAILSAEAPIDSNYLIFNLEESPSNPFGGTLYTWSQYSPPGYTTPFLLNYNWNQISDEVTLGTFQPGESFTVTYRIFARVRGNSRALDDEGGYLSGYAGAGFANHLNESAISIESVTVVPPVNDEDNDGIHDLVDTQLSIFSHDFSDITIGGTTTGAIVSRGDQILTVTEETNPAGVRISADPAGGSTAASVSVCGGTSILNLDAGDEIILTCSSVSIEIIRGSVEIEFIADNGVSAKTVLGAGNYLTFEPITATISIPLNNEQDVIVIINEVEFFIAPGETFKISDTDGDGVLDYDDECLGTSKGVAVASDGCSVYQALEKSCPANSNWKNHGKYVSCVAHTSEEYRDMGVITQEEKDMIVSEAAKSDIGK